jgi:predicted acyl esterase
MVKNESNLKEFMMIEEITNIIRTFVDVEMYPSSTFFTSGETLQLVVASDEIIPSLPFRKSSEGVNFGTDVLHFGGKYDSYLLVPKIPPREE